MKYILMGLFIQFFSIPAFSAIYKTQIHSIDIGLREKPHLVMLTDGHVAFLEGHAKSLLDEIEESLRKGDWVEVVLDENLNLLSIKTVNPVQVEESEDGRLKEEISYDPSIITYAQARSAFKNMRGHYQNESQCYNRAHVWTYEEFQRTAIKSNKLFLFFTSKYIRAFRYHWWFHVTPMVYVGGNHQSNWRTLDRRYSKGPLNTKTWTNIFMNNDAVCPIVYKYSDYRQHQQKEWCYLIPTSMYFWQPRDIEGYERTGYEKTNYISSEVSHAYWEAF